MTRRYNESGAAGAHVRDLLSAYIDKELTPPENESVRSHLATCADCRADFVELRATRRLLGSLPVVAPPRAFTLTEEMARAARPSPAGWLQRLLAPRNAPRLATGSALSFVMLALLFFGSFYTSQRVVSTFSRIGSGLSGVAQAPAAAESQKQSAQPFGTAQPLPAAGFDSTTGAGAAAPTETAAPAAQASGATETPATALQATGPSSAGGAAEATTAPVSGFIPPEASAAVTPQAYVFSTGAGSPSTTGLDNTRVAGGSGGVSLQALPLLELALLLLGLLFGVGALFARRET